MNKVLTTILLFFSALAFAQDDDGDNSEKATAERALSRNGVTAHRGYSGLYVENTMPAFEAALVLDIDWLECDIFLSADGRIVVTHDLSTARLTGVHASIKDLTFAEIATLDTAVDFRREHQTDETITPPQRMPLLSDVIALVMKQDRTRLSIQPKDEATASAIALIREMGAEKWVGFNDGNLKKMSLVKKLAPEIPVFWDRVNVENADQDLQIAIDRGFEALVYNQRLITPEAIAKVQNAGLKFGVWTVNDPEKMEEFIALGVDRLYTNYPEQALELFAQYQRVLPNERKTE
jgi:glycerophosphoryl diester phosphodiesterase